MSYLADARLGRLHTAGGDLVRAQSHFELALEGAAETLGSEHPAVLRAAARVEQIRHARRGNRLVGQAVGRSPDRPANGVSIHLPAAGVSGI